MDVNLDEAMKAAVTKVIFESLTERKRDELLQNAIQSLLTTPPHEGGFGAKQRNSPLADMFKEAVQNIARKMVGEKVDADAKLKAELEKIYAEAFQKVFVDEREVVVDNLAKAIGTALENIRYP
jgi:hypothetical protein